MLWMLGAPLVDIGKLRSLLATAELADELTNGVGSDVSVTNGVAPNCSVIGVGVLLYLFSRSAPASVLMLTNVLTPHVAAMPNRPFVVIATVVVPGSLITFVIWCTDGM